MNETSRLNITIEPANNGRAKVTAQLNDEPIFVESFELADSTARLRFAESLKIKVPSLDLANIEHVLTKEAAKDVGKRNSQPKVTTPWIPFPVDALPSTVARFVNDGAKAIGCDPSYLALPVLTTLAAAIGDTHRLELKRGWGAPAILWSAIVGESGSAKSPAFRLVNRIIQERQGKAHDRYAEASRAYERELVQYEKDLSYWKRQRSSTSDPPVKPEQPAAERFIISDTTVEALAPILSANARGVLLARDELAGWFGSFDRYSSGKGGADESHWLSMFNGESLTVDRKTGSPRTIYVPHALVSITGGIQPGILRRALTTQRRESGLAARFLFACPPRKPKSWTENDIDPSRLAEFSALLDRLYSMEADRDDEGARRPYVVGLTGEARRVWIAYYQEHNATLATLNNDLAAAWSKLEEYAARFALIHHLARWAGGEAPLIDPLEVDVESMRAGVTLANWFKNETQRIYAILEESDGERDRRELVEWIAGRGGRITARELQQGRRVIQDAEQAERALADLVESGLGRWLPSEPSAKGGRPTRVFELHEPSTVYETPETRLETQGFVDVDKANDPSATPANEWGEV